MSDPVLVAVISAVAIVLVAAIGLGTQLILRKLTTAATAATAAKEAAAVAKEAAEQSRREVILVGDKLMEVGKQLDGRLSELLAEARRTSRAEGYSAGEQAQRDRWSPSDQGGEK